MRIKSVTEISTNQQPNSNLLFNAGITETGKSSSLTSFEECLKSQIQDVGASAMTRKAEMLAVSSIWGYYMPHMVSLRPELKHRASDVESQSDL